MRSRFRRLRMAAIAIVVFAGLIYLNNASWLADPLPHGPFWVAHRALGQGFEREGLTNKTCTAARMLPPEHEYLENTMASISAAFEFGAETIEIDIHPTTDGRFAVFHDWTVDCRTEGSGVTREHTLEALQQLDAGYGYTADGGATFPFRGKGIGMIPSLEEVLTTHPDRNFILDIKGNDIDEGVRLAERIAALQRHRTGSVGFVGGADAVRVVHERLPDAQTMSRRRLKRCLKRYLAVGWTGYVPADCRRGITLVPANAAPWLWGWPNRFLQRMDRVGSRVVLFGDYRRGGLIQGFDDPAQLAELPDDYSGGIWTDRIDLMGPALSGREKP